MFLLWLAAAQAAEPETWALKQVVAVEVRDPNPTSDGWATTTTTGWSLVRWTREGEAVRFEEQPCAVETTPVLGTSTIYSEAFVRALRGPERQATLAEGRFRAAWQHALGPDDADGDGQPGVTVTVKQAILGQGDVYVAQKSSVVLDGRVDGERIVGKVTVDTAQEVLGATTWWLKLSTRQRPDRDRSAFVLAPVPSGMDCAALLASDATVFAP